MSACTFEKYKIIFESINSEGLKINQSVNL